jgi:hypothetical protein
MWNKGYMVHGIQSPEATTGKLKFIFLMKPNEGRKFVVSLTNAVSIFFSKMSMRANAFGGLTSELMCQTFRMRRIGETITIPLPESPDHLPASAHASVFKQHAVRWAHLQTVICLPPAPPCYAAQQSILSILPNYSRNPMPSDAILLHLRPRLRANRPRAEQDGSSQARTGAKAEAQIAERQRSTDWGGEIGRERTDHGATDTVAEAGTRAERQDSTHTC